MAYHMLAMCSTSSSHGQPDRVLLAIGCYVHGVDHVADEEQAPAARALLAVQLLDQVGLLGLAGDQGHFAALVGDGHDDLGAVLNNLDLHGDLRAVLVAVLDRVHGGLGDRGLEAFEPLGGDAGRGSGLGYPADREALVAWFAGEGERIQPPGALRTPGRRLGY